MKSFKSKDKRVLVSTREWKEGHPGGVNCESDTYYARLSTKLATLIMRYMGAENGIYENAVKKTAISLAAYLEDKVTGLNEWNAFLSLYQEACGRTFPFYNDVKAEELLADEINYPEVKYLLWRGINRSNPTTLVNPLNDLVDEVACKVMDILDEEYEVAPTSPEMAEFLFDESIATNVEELRSKCGWIVSRSYMFGVVKDVEIFEPIMAMYQHMMPPENYDINMLGYMCEMYFYMNTKCGPLKKYPSQWYAQMLKLSENETLRALAPDVEAIESRELLPYKVLNVDGDSFTALSVSGVEMTFSFDMFDDTVAENIKADQVVSCSTFSYKGIWHLNGIAMISTPESTDKFNDSLAEFKKIDESAKQTYEKLLEKNGGSPIGVAADWAEMSERFELDKEHNKDYNGMEAPIKRATQIAYFINSDSNMTILPMGAGLLNIEGNTLYDAKKARRASAPFVLDPQMSDEMRDYILTHNLIPDARLAGPIEDEDAQKWFAENASFLGLMLSTDVPQFNHK